jgi:hypothetical protein
MSVVMAALAFFWAVAAAMQTTYALRGDIVVRDARWPIAEATVAPDTRMGRRKPPLDSRVGSVVPAARRRPHAVSGIAVELSQRLAANLKQDPKASPSAGLSSFYSSTFLRVSVVAAISTQVNVIASHDRASRRWKTQLEAPGGLVMSISTWVSGQPMSEKPRMNRRHTDTVLGVLELVDHEPQLERANASAAGRRTSAAVVRASLSLNPVMGCLSRARACGGAGRG